MVAAPEKWRQFSAEREAKIAQANAAGKAERDRMIAMAHQRQAGVDANAQRLHQESLRPGPFTPPYQGPVRD
ncbi:MAG: hypothetical protein AAFQ84_07740 [Pseudomonadota bacterium]